jgi:hypothetical protein
MLYSMLPSTAHWQDTQTYKPYTQQVSRSRVVWGAGERGVYVSHPLG